MNKTKSLKQSKTVWLNIITIAISIVGFIPQLTGGMGLSPEAAAIIGKTTLMVSGVLNLVLRVFFTDTVIK